MNPLSWLETFIYILSTALFYPVLLGLILLVGWVALAAGGLFRELLERGRDPDREVSRWRVRLDELATGQRDRRGGADIALQQVLGEAERRYARTLDRVRFAVRVGPSLGLMGTLIPMATALASLAGGDLPSLARNMVTAFATTVVGLAIGVVAYLLTLTRQRWAERDMEALRLHAERAHRDLTRNPVREEESDALHSPSFV